jgi:hypothetical protein
MAKVCWFPNQFQYLTLLILAPLVQMYVRSGIKKMGKIGPSHWPSEHGKLFQGPVSVMHVNEWGIPCESHKIVCLSHVVATSWSEVTKKN